MSKANLNYLKTKQISNTISINVKIEKVFKISFNDKLTKPAQELKNRFKASFVYEALCLPSIYNDFQFPKTPVITNRDTETIQLYQWA